MAKMLATPEILAPAGDEDSLQAAIGAGADAVYFGLKDGFNARARAGNFSLDNAGEVFDKLHRVGMQGFVTMNTLVFESELEVAAKIITRLADVGADALIVQDLGVASLARELRPQLAIHASTQMTISSGESAAIAARLGVTRIVLPRELSVEEIKKFAAQTDLELECFVHGALCMSWSGQCLTSEALQSRSANRGQCAQTCRLPYGLFIDGEKQDTADVRYLLSPKDLSALNHIGDLLKAGVSCFKIEGRLKGPEYVANSVEKYRRALDAAIEGRAYDGSKDLAELRMTFSRGFGPGFLAGSDHQSLVHGKYPGHRGWLIGKVIAVDADEGLVTVAPEVDAPSLQGGDRVLFDQDRPEEDEPRGTLFSATVSHGEMELGFGRDPSKGGTDLSQVRVGNPVYKTRDTALSKRLMALAGQSRTLPLDLQVIAKAGAPLQATATDKLGRTATVTSTQPLEPARGQGLDEALLRDKLGAFGGSRFALRHLICDVQPGLHCSPADMKTMRRRLVELLEGADIPKTPLAPPVRVPQGAVRTVAPVASTTPLLIPLLRTLPQVDATLALASELGLHEVALDFMELVGLGAAVAAVKKAGLKVTIATPRVQKPGEEAYDKRFEQLAPDAVLARHLGAVEHFALNPRHQHLKVIGDFSLNATNTQTAQTLLGYGLDVLTPAYDLDLVQLSAMLQALPKERIEVTLHQHLPLYHTEHCVYSHMMSEGRDYRTCGRPCEKHTVALREDNGLTHPVLVDIGCRNTVFNARAQSAASCYDKLNKLGVRRYRVELVRETPAETERVLRAYAALLNGERGASDVLRTVSATERYGVSSGTLAVIA